MSWLLFNLGKSASGPPVPETHHRVVMKYSGRSRWHDGTLSLRADDELLRRFRSWFCDMIGIDRSAFAEPQAYLPLVNTVLPDGNVELA